MSLDVVIFIGLGVVALLGTIAIWGADVVWLIVSMLRKDSGTETKKSKTASTPPPISNPTKRNGHDR